MTFSNYFSKPQKTILVMLLAESLQITQECLRSNIREKCEAFFLKHVHNLLFEYGVEPSFQEKLAEVLSLWDTEKAEKEELASILSGLAFIAKSHSLKSPKALHDYLEAKKRQSKNLFFAAKNNMEKDKIAAYSVKV